MRKGVHLRSIDDWGDTGATEIPAVLPPGVDRPISPPISNDAELSRSRAEIEQLRHELGLVYSSPTWELGRKARKLLAWPGVPGHLVGRPLTLVPLFDIEAKPLPGRRAEWTFKSNDPQIALRWARNVPLPYGHYEIVMEIPDEADWNRTMRLYVDTGRGYREDQSVQLDFARKSPGCYVAMFDLQDLTESLRLDPADKVGSLVIGRANLRLLERNEFYLRGLFKVVREFRESGQPWARAVRWAARSLSRDGVSGLARDIRERVAGAGADTYARWIERHDTLTDAKLEQLRGELAAIQELPRIAVLMPVYNTPEKLLREAIDSVIAQVHTDWELCIADDCSTAPHVARVLGAYAGKDKRIRWVRRETNGHISRASNSALELVTADWVALLDHDDILRPHALAEVAKEIARHRDAELIYSDEDKLSEAGTRYDPNFKPDFSRELFRSQNYLNHLTVHRTANVRAVGGWRTGFEGSQDYDLNLRVCEQVGFRNIRHIPKVLYHWRAVKGSTAAALSEKSYAYQAGFRALEEHVERLGLPAKVEQVPNLPFYRLRFFVPKPPPLVSLIIPTRDRVELLERAVGSILDKTTYQNYEIIVVDNGSTDPRTLAYLKEIDDGTRVRVLRYDKPFNYSAINNYAATHARGEILGLINNDVEVIAPDWLTEMVSWAAQPDIGCVGAKLYYPNDTIQHAGVILGIGGVAGHSHKYFSRASNGYFSRLRLVQNLSAVTGACLLVRKDVFQRVGGLDEINLKVAFNDVDLCLKVQRSGLVNVWTPFAELYHHESLSRGAEDDPAKVQRFNQEATHMKNSWHLQDTYYSPNLTLVREDFSVAG